MIPRILLFAALTLTSAHLQAAEAPPDPSTIACTGRDDDAPAINAAIAAIRARAPASRFAWPVGRPGRLTLRGPRCLLLTTLDLTHLYGSGFALDAWGAEFLCRTAAGPCLDATGSGQLSLLGLNLTGDCETQTPRIGLVLARKTESLAEGADHNVLDHPTFAGCFTLAAFYNRASETTHITAGFFSNYADHAHAAIWDGTAAFDVQSAFYTERYKPGRFSSFNENTCETCAFETFGHGSVPLWIGGAVRHKFLNGYALAKAAEGGPALILSFANHAPNDFLTLGLHFENASLGAALLITGAERPTIHGLTIEDSYPTQNGPLFQRESGVKHVTIEDADFHIGPMPQPQARGFDDETAYSVSGRIYSQDGRVAPPAGFSGWSCSGIKCGWR